MSELPKTGLVRNAEGRWACPKCSSLSGDSWSQCEGSCPVLQSPHYDPKAGKYPIADWRRAVANHETELGYLEWFEEKKEIPY